MGLLRRARINSEEGQNGSLNNPRTINFTGAVHIQG
jgi:hypothetical protein